MIKKLFFTGFKIVCFFILFLYILFNPFFSKIFPKLYTITVFNNRACNGLLNQADLNRKKLKKTFVFPVNKNLFKDRIFVTFEEENYLLNLGVFLKKEKALKFKKKIKFSRKYKWCFNKKSMKIRKIPFGYFLYLFFPDSSLNYFLEHQLYWSVLVFTITATWIIWFASKVKKKFLKRKVANSWIVLK